MAFSHDVRIIILAALLKGAASAMTAPVSQMLAGEAFAAAGAGVAVGFSSTTAQLTSSALGRFFGFTLHATGSFTVLWSTALEWVVMSMLFLTMVKERKWEGYSCTPASLSIQVHAGILDHLRPFGLDAARLDAAI